MLYTPYTNLAIILIYLSCRCVEIDKPLRGIQQVESENFLGSYNHQANTAYDHHQMIECPINYYDEKKFVPLTGSDQAGSQKDIVNSGQQHDKIISACL